ncbi:hypothetical protein FA15DRAFT_723652 [Coprinopsis marcescibilis]|uniref:Uncharacterized protein n=1 Tax=Coprinopsis marcescibilis TaxID=230819 RepID=A0A5C3KHP0_COPMA|nr:hypothetical protein FA15DRAFT_723652 [Coprinopsis marcescibilis]
MSSRIKIPPYIVILIIIGLAGGLGLLCMVTILTVQYFKARKRLSTAAASAATRSEDVELPMYGQHTRDQRVNPGNIQYDVPAAFDLARAVSDSVPVLDTQSTTYERMRRVQGHVTALRRLMAAAPVDGYPQDSPALDKIHTLRAKIASLTEPASNQPQTSAVTANSVAIVSTPLAEPPGTAPGSTTITSVPVQSSSSGQHGTLYERMMQVQQLLAQMDRLSSAMARAREASESTTESRNFNAEVELLQRRITQMMEPTVTPEAGGSSFSAELAPRSSFVEALSSSDNARAGRQGVPVTSGPENTRSGVDRAHSPPPPYSTTNTTEHETNIGRGFAVAG